MFKSLSINYDLFKQNNNNAKSFEEFDWQFKNGIIKFFDCYIWQHTELLLCQWKRKEDSQEEDKEKYKEVEKEEIEKVEYQEKVQNIDSTLVSQIAKNQDSVLYKISIQLQLRS